tara:strand:- start:2501 stop:3202 length:702 start_codon:yes stop_codon:yes gene_type:complete
MIIYLCAFKKKEYIEEAKICIESIKKNGNFNGTIYLFTDIKINIENVIVINVDVESVYLSASYRLRFFEHFNLKDIDKNEIILYLDTDVVVLNTIPCFYNINSKIQVYGYPERTQNHHHFAGCITRNKKYIDKMAICSGILLFRPCEEVKNCFDESYNLYLDLIKKNKVNCCWEQPSLCYTLTKLDMVDISLIDITCEERSLNNKPIEKHIVFNHFCGMRSEDRYLKMKKYLM